MKGLVRLIIFGGWVAGLLAIVAGCDDDPVGGSEIRAMYTGELRWDKTPGLVGGNDVDTVAIMITGQAFTYDLVSNKGLFCEATGTVGRFGTDSAVFTVNAVTGLPCDSVRILRGAFRTVFRNDSLFMSGMLRDGVRQMDYNYSLAETIF